METQQLFSRKISPDSINLLTKTTEKKKKLLGPSSSVLPLCQSSILSSLTAPEFIRVVFPVVYFMLFEPLAINRCWYTLPPPTTPPQPMAVVVVVVIAIGCKRTCTAVLSSEVETIFFSFVFLWQQQELKTSLVFSGINIVCGRKQKATGLWETHFAHRHSS